MPQIEQVAATFASQLFWVVLTFGLAYLIIGRGMVPKVQATMDDRDTQVAGDLQAAEAARVAADADEENWRSQENAAREAARQKLAAAKAQATARTEATLAASDAEHQVRVSAAEAQIAAASQAASGEIEGIAADLARDIVARVSGAPVSEDEARGAVKVVMHG
ncbi:F0F1 ATP synthase subunit B family protein [Sphingomonas qomolangmaensis]|uniref:ATP synthase subunit b n=1 Tax=Sphingomonas qomolangmaensis TaxID=2918765 RepID=A0ABY5L9T6_9SPHN|nr:ATPase [Sphingomonas qomolangmaensis]UUL82808.1 ATPase [Sphingomonas qomolangmaensis]